MRRVAVVDCSTTAAMTEAVAARARRAAAPGTTVLPVTLRWGAPSAEGWCPVRTDGDASAPEDPGAVPGGALRTPARPGLPPALLAVIRGGVVSERRR